MGFFGKATKHVKSTAKEKALRNRETFAEIFEKKKIKTNIQN